MTSSHHVEEKVESLAECLRPDAPAVFRLGVEALAKMRLGERDGYEAAAGGQDVAHLDIKGNQSKRADLTNGMVEQKERSCQLEEECDPSESGFPPTVAKDLVLRRAERRAWPFLSRRQSCRSRISDP